MPPKPNKKAGKDPKKDAKDPKGNKILIKENCNEDSVCYANFGAFDVKEEPSQLKVGGAFAKEKGEFLLLNLFTQTFKLFYYYTIYFLCL